jgi:hypothetical protein
MVAEPRTPPPGHGRAGPEQGARLDVLLEVLAPVLTRAFGCALTRALGADAVAAVLVDADARGRFLAPGPCAQVILDGANVTLLVVPRETARRAIAPKCAHCGDGFEASVAHRLGDGALVLHIDTRGFDACTMVISARGLR